jgi:hypothetical protein
VLRPLWHRHVVIRDEVQERYRTIRDAPSRVQRAGPIAGHTVRHSAAQVLSIGAGIALILGIGVAVVAVAWP